MYNNYHILYPNLIFLKHYIYVVDTIIENYRIMENNLNYFKKEATLAGKIGYFS
jgi:hypothetical protein